MKKWLSKLLSPNSGVSSKRVAGLSGWMLCLILVTYCTLTCTPSPDILEMLFICSSSLLGVDSITSIWNKNINK